MVSAGRKEALLLGAVRGAVAGVAPVISGDCSTLRAGGVPAATATADTAARA